MRDREPRPSFGAYTRPEGRQRQLKQALDQLVIPLVVAIVLDGIVQYLLFKRVRVLGAAVVGTLLMGVPYSLARGLTNRARRRWTKYHRDQ